MSNHPGFPTPHDGNTYDDDEPEPIKYGLNLVLFVLTAISVFWSGAAELDATLAESLDPRRLLEIWRGWPFAVPLLAILVAHESGHYVAARCHRVQASLPFFIPLPKLSPFGTLGAIIGMSGRIRSRVALLDIGAAGPLAGMVVALPVLAIGLSKSPILPNSEHYTQEGQSLLYMLMKRVFAGPIPDGSDVQLHLTAMAGWVGLLVTMINMLPWGQLDGGHIAYALFGERQHAIARWVRRSLLLLFAFNVVRFVTPVVLHKSSLGYGFALSNSLFWLIWFGFTGLVGRISGGAEHPPFEPGELGGGRRAVAWLCLIMFVLLFMPTPYAIY
ncbi:MAG TPA: site-2 protease family protein [Polyangiaceae bacterium]